MTTPFNRVKFTPVAGGTGSFVVSAAVTGYSTPAQRGVPTGTVVSYTAESADKTEWETGIGTYTSGTVTLARTTIRENSNADTSPVNFSAAPSVWIDWHAQELSNYVAPAASAAVGAGSDISITSGAGGSTSGAGGEVSIVAGSATTTGSGGGITLTTGAGGAIGGGGMLSLKAANTPGAGEGGTAKLLSGHGESGGNMQITAGNGSAGDGGDITIRCGTGTNSGGEVSLIGGSCTDLGPAFGVTIVSGNGGPNGGRGGNLDCLLGSALAGDSEGGSFAMQCGNSTGIEAGGHFEIDTGDGGASAAGGDIVFTYGTGGVRNGLFFPNLPTANPGVSGAMWNDSGTVKIA